jgi:ketosteroid isomerase-like protein
VTSNESRATTLVRALRAGVDGDREALQALLTDDVRAWTPALSTTSRSELIDELVRRDDAFSVVELDVRPLDVGGAYACVEWTVEMVHTGSILVVDERSVEPSGIHVVLHGVTVAEFHDDRICSLRQYWDKLAVLEQLGVLTELDAPGDAATPAPA